MKKKLIGLALAVGAAAAVAKLMVAKKAEWEGLTEDEVRAKVEQRMPSRVPEQRRSALADNVVSKMRDRGMLADEEPAVAAEPAAPAEEPASEPEPEAEEPAPEPEPEAGEEEEKPEA